MTESPSPYRGLRGVAETLLFPLYVRALESRRPDALLRDSRAATLVAQRPADFAEVEKVRMDEQDRVALILRSREMDRRAKEFLAHHPGGVVVHIGCGLDTRFERVDDGRVQWYDLDLPEVIELRRELIGDEGPRHQLVACSVFESAWMDAVGDQPERSFMFIAEGVFMYFEKSKVRSLVLTLRERFPGAELVFDAFSPFLVRANNLRFRLSGTKIAARYSWGLRRARDLEAWGEGISLLDEWHLFDRPEPRLARARWMRHVPPLAKIMGIFHYRLGEALPATAARRGELPQSAY